MESEWEYPKKTRHSRATRVSKAAVNVQQPVTALGAPELRARLTAVLERSSSSSTLRPVTSVLAHIRRILEERQLRHVILLGSGAPSSSQNAVEQCACAIRVAREFGVRRVLWCDPVLGAVDVSVGSEFGLEHDGDALRRAVKEEDGVLWIMVHCDRAVYEELLCQDLRGTHLVVGNSLRRYADLPRSVAGGEGNVNLTELLDRTEYEELAVDVDRSSDASYAAFNDTYVIDYGRIAKQAVALTVASKATQAS